MTMPALAAALADRYQLERELGAGGMATVFLAQDLRHDRQVAIKVLRPELAAVIGADRFLSEIRTTANLQHPHILPLFDSGRAAGPSGRGDEFVFYVMPYVGGESLRERLTRDKQLPIPEAVRIATEVASALDYAHRHGVIHRDIKPENVMLHDGQALVADFGIALAASSAGSRMTETGMSLGTPHYMSPEQAMGERELSARSDIYALGAMTYEMLVGDPPFTGSTAQAIVAKVMTEKPAPPSRFRDTVPETVEQAVLTALQKLPADRQASAAEFAAELSAARPGGATRAAGARGTRGALALLGIAAALGLGWMAGRASDGRGGAGPLPPARLALLTPSLGGSGTGGNNRQLALTPDGAAVVFVDGAVLGGAGGLTYQRLDEETGRRIPGSELTYAPAISPDARWVAVRSIAGDAMVIPVAGGGPAPSPIARGSAFYAWDADGALWITRAPYDRLERYHPGTATLEAVIDSLPRTVWIQQVLEDGRTALVVQSGVGSASGTAALLDLATGQQTTLLTEAVVTVRYAAGFVVYATPTGALVARPFDPDSRQLGDQVTNVAQGVSVTGSGEAQFDLSTSGTLVYVPEEPRALVFVDRRGTERLATEERHSFHMPRFSPDGRRLLTDFTTADGRDVWILDPAQQTLTRATFDRDGHDGIWSRDGRAITYLSSRAGNLGLYRIPVGGTAAESLLTSRQLNLSGVWHPTGQDLLTVAVDLQPGSSQDIAVVRNDGRGPIEPLVATRFRENYPALSPDGRWVAYLSDQSGRPEVYVRSWSDGGALMQVSQGGGGDPMWSSDGRELFYIAQYESGMMMTAARIETVPTLRVSTRTPLFSVANYVTTTPHANYDVAPDGGGFVMVRRSPSARIMVIPDLRALVERRG